MKPCVLTTVASLVGSLASWAAQPIQLHPQNPHYFFWRERPMLLLTATEHYGAVLNLDFNQTRYLDELAAHHFNLTRVFSGSYREVAASFQITGNTLAPADNRFVCPWARRAALADANKFDLTQWDPAYFERLKEFITQAGRRGIVVELVLFCTMYDDAIWNASPMNARNNVNGIGAVKRDQVYTGRNAELLGVQTALVQKLVNELNAYDNLYYEICNEPYERSGLTREWHDKIIATLVTAEASLPQKHLIAENIPPSDRAVRDLSPHVSILNFHAAKPEMVRFNHALNKAVAYDETGGGDRDDWRYRTEGWDFILAGGAVYDHLDFSFIPGKEDGSAVPLPLGTPGGGGPNLRRQLSALKQFIESFDFVRMTRDDAVVKAIRIITPEATVRSRPRAKPSVRALSEPGKAYALYVNGGTKADLELQLPPGDYEFNWLEPKTGIASETNQFHHAAGAKLLTSPTYSEDIALRLRAAAAGR